MKKERTNERKETLIYPCRTNFRINEYAQHQPEPVKPSRLTGITADRIIKILYTHIQMVMVCTEDDIKKDHFHFILILKCIFIVRERIILYDIPLNLMRIHIMGERNR